MSPNDGYAVTPERSAELHDGVGTDVHLAPALPADADHAGGDPSVGASSGADGLGRRTARGAAVTIAGQLTQLLLQLTSVIVLARLLSPRDYGLYAMVLVIVGIGEIFRDFGLSSAAIQAKELSDAERDKLFWVNAGLGAGLTVLTFVAAPVIAAVFGQPHLIAIARVLALTFLVNGLVTQYRAGLNRDMRFGALAAADLSAMALSIAVAIAGAAAGFGYWALVASQLAQVVTVLVIVVACAGWRPGRPRRDVDLSRFLHFGWRFVATQIVYYASNNVDSLTIAARLGPSPLGVYNRAFQLLMNPLNQFRTPATTVALPVLSRLQDDVRRAGEYLRRGQITIGYTVVAGLALGAGTAQPLVHLLLGSQWREVTPVFALLAISGVFQMLSFVGYWAYLSRALTGELLRYSLVSFAIKVVCVLVGSTWGLVGVAGGYMVAPAIAWPISLWWLSRKTVIPVRELYAGAGRIIGLAVIGGVLAFSASRLAEGSPDLVRVVCGAVALCVGYALAAFASRQVRRDLASMTEVVRRVFAR